MTTTQGKSQRRRAQQIAEVTIARLKPAPHNARSHSPRQIKLLARSIERFGFVAPVIIDKNQQIVAGHGRILAARRLGLETVPAVMIEYLSDVELRAYLVADNRLAEKSAWDKKLLAVQLEEFQELGFDLAEIGFEPAEVDILLEEAAEAAGKSEDDGELLPALAATAISRDGDLWRLGDHVLICGDAADPLAYRRLLDGKKAKFVFTDPPYNVPITGHVSGLGRTHHREFEQACGEMTSTQFTDFLARAFQQTANHSIRGSIHQICMDWRHAREMLAAGDRVYYELLNICVWNKTNAGMGSLYRSQHELIFVWQNGKGSHTNNVELGRHGRSRSNVWTYAGANTFKRGRMDELAMHPTVKPVALVADAIKDCSSRGDLILDPFAGSGTVLIASERTGRRARAVELDPCYVDVTIRRWQNHSGRLARHLDTGLTLDELEERRVAAEQGKAVR